MKSESSRIEI